jgi:PAS domain S-box-containing protein
MKKNGGKRAWPAAGPFLPQSRLGEVAAAGLQAVPGGTPGIAVRLFRRLFEQTPDGVSINELLLDDRGAPCNYRVLEVNPAFERLTGLGRDEVLGRTAKELLFHRDDRWFADFSEVVRTGRQMRFEWRSRRLGKFFEASACALEDGRFAIFLKDITEQREAERALRESEAKYRLLVEQLPAVTYMHIFDGPSKGTYLSSQAEAMLGLDQGQGRPDFSANPGLWRDMVHPEDRARFLVELDQARETRRPLDCEYRFLTRDGRTPWLHDKAVFLRDETGNPVGIQGVLFDVSDRKLAESRLKDSLSFLQTLMDAVPHPVFYKDRERRFIGCNRAFGDYIGLPVEALIGRRACELFPGGQAEGYEKQDDEMLSEPGELIYEQRVRHGDGSLRHALLHKATFAGADGRVGGIVGTVTDITGLREAEKKS